MTPATLLLPISLGIALLAGAFTGYVAPEQLAAGAALLLVPGADRFAPLLRQLLRPAGGAPAAPGQPGLLTLPTEEVHRLAGVAYESYAAATGGKTFDGRPMPTWEEARERIGHAWAAAVTGVLSDQANQPILRLVPPAPPPPPAPPASPPGLPPIALLLLLLPLLGSLVWGCSPALRGALLACAAAEVSPTVSTAAELALHQGEGWQEALARLVLSAGECAVRAAVRAVADRPPAAQPMGLMAGAGVSPQEVQARAQSWIKGRR